MTGSSTGGISVNSSASSQQVNVIAGEAEIVEGRRGKARIRASTILSDERRGTNGGQTAPTPQEYFLASILL